MEYIFEDFLAGFLENKFSKDWKIEYQKSDEYLSNIPRVFNMQHDIFLTSRHGSKRKVIVDTKYKLRQDNFKTDPKKGIAQADLYQMVSYAFKRGCTDIILVYPNISDELNTADNFTIISGFSGADEITVTAMEIPFSSLTNFNKLDSMLYETIETQLNNLSQ
jgi:5-methylcytosine-specific restriction enzyme subunit McrC